MKGNINIQFVTSMYAMLTNLSKLCKPEHIIEASKEAYGKDIRGKMHSTGNTFLTKHEVSSYEAIKRVLFQPMRHSNLDVLYVSMGLSKNRTEILKWLSILEKMNPEDKSVFVSNIIDKYENRSDHLHSLNLAGFVSTYVSQK